MFIALTSLIATNQILKRETEKYFVKTDEEDIKISREEANV
jgi:hypothetical protein